PIVLGSFMKRIVLLLPILTVLLLAGYNLPAKQQAGTTVSSQDRFDGTWEGKLTSSRPKAVTQTNDSNVNEINVTLVVSGNTMNSSFKTVLSDTSFQYHRGANLKFNGNKMTTTSSFRGDWTLVLNAD